MVINDVYHPAWVEVALVIQYPPLQHMSIISFVIQQVFITETNVCQPLLESNSDIDDNLLLCAEGEGTATCKVLTMNLSKIKPKHLQRAIVEDL